MTQEIKVLGKRVLVKKEKIDSNGFALSPVMEAEGEKNRGVVVAVGDIGAKAENAGLKVGVTVLFKKHFIPNHVDGEEPLVFVEVDDLMGIII